jgi:hypothetical protein
MVTMLASQFEEEIIELLVEISKVKFNLERLSLTEREIVTIVNDLELTQKSDRLRAEEISKFLTYGDGFFKLKLVTLTKTTLIIALALLMIQCLSLPHGYGTFIATILKLFKDGKISRTAFEQLRDTALNLDTEEQMTRMQNIQRITQMLYNNETFRKEVLEKVAELPILKDINE